MSMCISPNGPVLQSGKQIQTYKASMVSLKNVVALK